MEGGWCRLCELEESYIKDVQSLPPCQTSWCVLLAVWIKSRNTKRNKGGGVQGLGLKPLHPCFKIKRATDKGLNAAVWLNVGFCGSHSDCCVSQWSVTKWAITPVGLAIYYWYESQTTRRRQWFMLEHFNPNNWHFDILLHTILQSILILYFFAKAVFLEGLILSVSFWQLWEFLNNWWRPWVTEFLGMGASTKKAWFVVSAQSIQQGSKMAINRIFSKISKQQVKSQV